MRIATRAPDASALRPLQPGTVRIAHRGQRELEQHIMGSGPACIWWPTVVDDEEWDHLVRERSAVEL